MSKMLFCSLTRALVGSFYNAIWWGGLFLAPLVSQELLDRFTKLKQRLIALDNSSSENKKCWPRGHRWRHRSGQSQNVWPFALDGIGAQNIDIKRMGSWYIDINRVSNIYKYRYEHLRLMSGQGHPRSRGQERSNLYFRPLCDSMHVYGSDFRKEREKWPKTSFFRTQIEQNLKIGK